MFGRNKSAFTFNFASAKQRRLALSICGAVGVGTLIYRQHKTYQWSSSLLREAAQHCVNLAQSDLVSGGVAYLAQIVILYPVDTLKVQLQHKSVSALKPIILVVALIKCQADNSSICQTLQRLGRSGNIGCLFSGIGATAVCSCLVGGVFFSSYTWGKRIAENVINCYVPTMCNDLSLGVELFGSLCSWGMTALVDAPVEMLRHQAQAGVLKTGMWRGIVSCFRKNRIASLYCCLIPYMIKSLPFDVAELMTHGQLDSARRSSSHLALIPEPLWGLFAGGVAGSCAVISSMPFDCIKTRMEIQSAAGKDCKKFIACGISMVQTEGLRSLWRGIVPRLIVYVPGTALYWMIIDTLQEMTY